MSLEYAAYLALVSAGSLALARVFSLTLEWKCVAIVLAFIIPLFFFWDSLAAFFGWWVFGTEHMLGVFVGNQPLEEVLFFAAIPFFYIVSWEIVKRT